ncbi:P-loop NTPase fold protein [Burkholderia sp. 22PA0099]|uniref:KAP family P-loop NTPase fold protein n=1 Tax=Burkholderia sp. 22PA0099 TaxID=3237372 RepID=UPI0039C4AF2F
MTDQPTVTFQHDRPQVEVDLYGRKNFAEQLSVLLTLPPSSPGIVVGIEGAWGSGKSTVVRYIVDALKGSPNEAPIIVEFNPWMLAGADALVEALLTELATGIGAGAGKKKAKTALEVTGKILGYVGLLRHLKYLKYVPGISLAGVAAEAVGTALHDAGKVASKAATAADDAKKVIEEAEKLVSVKSGLTERKQEVVKALEDLDQSILVVVDDLDRLTPDEIKAVFRTIKAVADFPRVAYLLAYDREIVSESLGGGLIAGGDAYIEKIVQVAYPISPAFPWQLLEHIKNDVDAVLLRLGRDLEPFETELMGRARGLACNLCRYPRDIIRLVNRLTLSFAGTHHEVNAADVLVAEALFQRFPKIRDAVLRHPEQFTGTYWSVEDESIDTDWSMFMSVTRDERRVAWEACLPEEKAERAIASAALKFLFPLTSGVNPNSYPLNHLRLSDLSRLIRFLARTSVSGVHEVAHIHALLANPAGVADLVNSLELSKAVEMVEHMVAYLETAPSVAAEELIKQLINVCSLEKLPADGNRKFSRAVGLLAANCISGYWLEPRHRVENFVEEVPVTYGVDFIVAIGAYHGEIRELSQRNIDDAKNLISNKSVVVGAIDLWLSKAKREIRSGAVVKSGHIFALLYGISHFGKNSKISDAAESLRTLCNSVLGGLAFFLESANRLKELQSEVFYVYVWDADEMADSVAEANMSESFDWYVNQLRTNVQIRGYISKMNPKEV